MAKKSVIPLEDLQKKLTQKTIQKNSLIKAQEDFNALVLEMIRETNQKKQFKDLKFFTLGSLSYGGLCPYSDIDLLAVGEKELVELFSLALEERISNVKIKWWPKLDINLATDIFDHIFLYFIKPLDSEDNDLLTEFKYAQSKLIYKNLEKYRLDLLKDRISRRSRYGAVGGELSPNLKYGPGGLRDTCQALAWLGWAESYKRHSVALSQSVLDGLAKIYQFRFALQYLFQTDQLTLESWSDLLSLLSWTDLDKKQLYKALFQQFTFTELIFDKECFDLIFEDLKIKSAPKKLKIQTLLSLNISNAKYWAYEFKNSIQIKSIKDKKKSSANSKAYDKEGGLLSVEVFDWIHELFLKANSAWEIDFILDSGLLSLLLKNDWDHISGLAQSDHYHKFTVSEHLRQTLKAVCALQVQNDLRFSMNTSCEEVSTVDWRILKWVAIFHDLKKGHPEDHSSLGRLAVEGFDFFSTEEKQAIGALVDHHLRLSTFAFRYEHSDQAQLQILNDLFEVSQWIRLLLVFTGADIIGSNPMAWNKWKSDQLYFAYKSLMDFRNDKVNLDTEDVGGFELSPYLVKVVGLELLKEDLLLLKQSHDQGEFEEDWLVESIDDNLWIRVFKKDLGPGTLSHILNQLYIAGLPVEQAFISSSSATKGGAYVYNWFRLPSTFVKPKAQIQKRIKVLSLQKIFTEKNLTAKVDKVIFLTENQNKLSFLFKGQDQNGVLLYISKIFESLGVNIHKAQINTWGNRIEDLFVVKKEGHQADSLVVKLNQSLNLPQSIKI